MASDAEQRLREQGVTIEDIDFGREDELDVTGCVVVNPVEGGLMVRAVARPGIPEWQRDMFTEWVESRLARFSEHGPDPDGWQHRADEAWQLWARLTQMPSLD